MGRPNLLRRRAPARPDRGRAVPGPARRGRGRSHRLGRQDGQREGFRILDSPSPRRAASCMRSSRHQKETDAVLAPLPHPAPPAPKRSSSRGRTRHRMGGVAPPGQGPSPAGEADPSSAIGPHAPRCGQPDAAESALVLFIVRPETLLRWHRELVRRKWMYKGEASPDGPRSTARRRPSSSAWEGRTPGGGTSASEASCSSSAFGSRPPRSDR